MFALEKTDLFNLMCIPPTQREASLDNSTLQAALAYCVRRRAMLIIDPPDSWKSVDQAANGIDSLTAALGGEQFIKNAALYFPRLKMSDPLKQNRLAEFVPCGAIAGTQ